ncbi:MAG: hypothetical protein AAF570_12625, partial [Bacteroidota bacterium]
TQWDALYAHAILPRQKPADREDVMNALRILNVFKQLAAQGSATLEDLQCWISQAPLIPESVIPSVEEADDLPEEETDDDPDFENKKAALLEASNLINAIKELEKVNHAGMKSMQANNYAKPSAENIVDNDDFAEDEHPDVSDPWKINAAAIAQIDGKTKSVIEGVCPDLDGEDYEEVISALRKEANDKLSRVYEGVDQDDVIQIGQLLNSSNATEPDLPEIGEELSNALSAMGSFSRKKTPIIPVPDPGRTRGNIRPLGVGDMKVVKQTLKRYEAGEVAHIENVMQGEERTRTHRTLDRIEDFSETETETNEKTVQDLQTTDRFELQKETEKTVQTDMALEAGLTISAKYGPVEVGANAGFSLENSRSESTKTASNYARDVTSRSLKEVEKKTREKRSTTRISEIEDTNLHSFKNDSENAEHIIGIYQWVDKVYEAQTFNYGTRLMFEFMIPEPAAFYIHANKSKLTEGVTLKKPTAPKRLSPKTLSPSNYRYFVKKYNVQGVAPPPDRVKIIGTTIDVTSQGEEEGKPGTYVRRNSEVKVPEGYEARWAWIRTARVEDEDADDYKIRVFVGKERCHVGRSNFYKRMNNEDDIIPIGVLAHNVLALLVNIEVKCVRSETLMAQWKLNTYNAIIDAYEAQKAAYERQVRNAQITFGTAISGRNPLRNREIERDEMKKHSITMLSGRRLAGFNSMRKAGGFGYPELHREQALQQSVFIRFFEQAFEWDQMTYKFLSYFWGKKKEWTTSMQWEDVDPLFGQFLRAGSSKVVVSVRPGFEEAVLHFLRTGE